MNKTTIFFLFISKLLIAQDIDYAKGVVEDLCAPEMHGRGYVENGSNLAADYIAAEFKQIGLRELSVDYRQDFEVNVNTQPGALSLKIGKQVLTPGEDYLVHPASPSLEGTFEIIYVHIDTLLHEPNYIELLNNAEGKLIGLLPAKKELTKQDQKDLDYVVRNMYDVFSNPSVGTIVFTDKKLTWHGATGQFSAPIFTVKYDAVKKLKNKATVVVESKFEADYPVQNIIGFIPGRSDSVILFSAHYDHLGRMGTETYFPGANDNASGTALMMSLAKYYARLKMRPKYGMLFIAFAAEEIGLLGSEYYTENPLMPLGKIKFQINLDICGTGDKGIQVVNGTEYQEQFELLQKINSDSEYLEQVKIRGESCNSDHCWFHRNNVPSFFIYTLGGAGHYHDIHDTAENLTLSEHEDFFRLLVDFVDKL